MKIQKNYQYVSKTDLPFGVKKGTIFLKKDNVYIDKNTGETTLYDCGDIKFFSKEEIVEPIFKVGTKLLLCVNIGKKRNNLNNFYKLNKNMVFTYLSETSICVTLSNENGLNYEFSYNDIKTKFKECVEYFYISDSGTVKSAISGVNENADAFRLKYNNMYDNLADVQMKLTDFLK
jgi:hypothetical protein